MVSKTITALPHTCKLNHLSDLTSIDEESVFYHIPTSLCGLLSDKLNDGLLLQLKCWYTTLESTKSQVENEFVKSCQTTLSVLAKQACVKYSCWCCYQIGYLLISTCSLFRTRFSRLSRPREFPPFSRAISRRLLRTVVRRK